MKQGYFTLYLSPYELEDLAEVFSEIEFHIHLLICSGPGEQQEYISMEMDNASEPLKHLGRKATFRRILDTVQSLDGSHIVDYHLIAYELSIKSATIVADDAIITFFNSDAKELYLSKIIALWNKDNRYDYKDLNGLKRGTLYKATAGKFEEVYTTTNSEELIFHIVEIENRVCDEGLLVEGEYFYYSDNPTTNVHFSEY